MFDSILNFLSNNTGLVAGGGAAGMVLWYGLGKMITLGMSKWSITKKFWNSTIEPWFIDLFDNVVGGAMRGLIKGLRVDD